MPVNASGSPVPTARANPPCSARCSAGRIQTLERPASERASRSARSTQARASVTGEATPGGDLRGTPADSRGRRDPHPAGQIRPHRRHVNRPADALSPGERTRAGLALLQASGVNLLVLDEPTNHLDLAAIEQLEQALESYTGTMLLVTHDRRMLSTVRLDRHWAVDSGRVTESVTGVAIGR